jgi:hypothetical protein
MKNLKIEVTIFTDYCETPDKGSIVNLWYVDENGYLDCINAIYLGSYNFKELFSKEPVDEDFFGWSYQKIKKFHLEIE